MPLVDRLELAAQACRAAHLLSCEETCREAAAIVATLRQGQSFQSETEAPSKLATILADARSSETYRQETQALHSAERRKTMKCEHPVCCPDLMRGLQQCEHWPDCQSAQSANEHTALGVKSDNAQDIRQPLIVSDDEVDALALHIEIDQVEAECIIAAEIARRLGEHQFDPKCLNIQVKSKQNYRSEWERADFKAIYHEVKV